MRVLELHRGARLTKERRQRCVVIGACQRGQPQWIRVEVVSGIAQLGRQPRSHFIVRATVANTTDNGSECLR